MITAKDLSYNGDSAVLLSYDDGQRALWVTDEYLAGRADEPGSYTLNDVNTSVPLGADEDIDAAVEDWKYNVEWGEIEE